MNKMFIKTTNNFVRYKSFSKSAIKLSVDSFAVWKEIFIRKLLTLKLIVVFLLMDIPGFNILHSNLTFPLSPYSWYSLFPFFFHLFYYLINLPIDLILTVLFWFQIGLLLDFQFIYPQLEWNFYLISLFYLGCTLNNVS